MEHGSHPCRDSRVGARPGRSLALEAEGRFGWILHGTCRPRRPRVGERCGPAPTGPADSGWPSPRRSGPICLTRARSPPPQRGAVRAAARPRPGARNRRHRPGPVHRSPRWDGRRHRGQASTRRHRLGRPTHGDGPRRLQPQHPGSWLQAPGRWDSRAQARLHSRRCRNGRGPCRHRRDHRVPLDEGPPAPRPGHLIVGPTFSHHCHGP